MHANVNMVSTVVPRPEHQEAERERVRKKVKGWSGLEGWREEDERKRGEQQI